jgi:CxxC-x17-CxxC domain-containing protein
MEFEDKTLTCRDCSQPFVFTAGEQGFYIEKGLMNLPQRCPSCRANRRNHRGSTTTPENSSTITCARCGKEATVPFVPRLDRPVYCGDCFSAVRSEKTPVGA